MITWHFCRPHSGCRGLACTCFYCPLSIEISRSGHLTLLATSWLLWILNNVELSMSTPFDVVCGIIIRYAKPWHIGYDTGLYNEPLGGRICLSAISHRKAELGGINILIRSLLQRTCVYIKLAFRISSSSCHHYFLKDSLRILLKS